MKKGSHDQSGSLRGGMIFVLVKAIVFTIAFLFVSVFVFGMRRCPDDSMSPSFQGGDLVLFNRLDREYRASDVVVVKTPKGLQVRRIVAVARDKVEIDGEGLKINGHLQSESKISFKERNQFSGQGQAWQRLRFGGRASKFRGQQNLWSGK